MRNTVPFALIFTIVFAFQAKAKDVQSSAGGDICNVRPDLCGGAPLPKKKKSQAHAHRRTARPARVQSEAARAAEEVELDFADMEEDNAHGFNRRPASAPAPTQIRGPLPSAVTYESYLQANARHPAIARRPASMASNQKAFLQPTVRATITGSTLDQPASSAAVAPGTLAPSGSTNRGVGDAQPASDGINPGDAPLYGVPADGGAPAPNR